MLLYLQALEPFNIYQYAINIVIWICISFRSQLSFIKYDLQVQYLIKSEPCLGTVCVALRRKEHLPALLSTFLRCFLLASLGLVLASPHDHHPPHPFFLG